MDPIVLGAAAALVLLLLRKRKKSASGSNAGTSPTTPASPRPGGPQGPAPGTDPWSGPFGPFEPPPTEPPPQPSGPGTDPSPIPVRPGVSPEELEDLGPHALAISQDCQDVHEGEDWYHDVFLPAARLLVGLSPDAFTHPWIVMRALLTFVDEEPECIEVDGEVECLPNLQPECVASWTMFLSVELDVPNGPWDSSTNHGYQAYLDYDGWYSSNYASVEQFLSSVEHRLWSDPGLGAHFDNYYDTDSPIEFIPPSIPEPEAA